MKKIVVIGAGPAGIMAGISAGMHGNDVTIIERNEKIGKKLFITGKGRCNITNNRDISEFFDFVCSNKEFLYSAFYTFTNKDTMDFFENAGIELKVERGERVFPASDKSYSILDGFKKNINKYGIDIKLNSRVIDIIKNGDNIIEKVILDSGEEIFADEFIITTGGVSYKSTGSTGDGHTLAKKVGHTVTKLSPFLVPINIHEKHIKEMQGLSLKNVNVSVYNAGKKAFSQIGEMIFTHFGVSGPLILSASGWITLNESKIVIDLKPALNHKELDNRILKDFSENPNKSYRNSLNGLLPQKMIGPIVDLSGINRDKKVNEITKEERKNLVNLLKELTFDVNSFRDIDEAIVTRGGVNVNEVDPSTMRSKIIKNLYFAGEVLDLDAYTGGFNIQIAISTGFLAGKSI